MTCKTVKILCSSSHWHHMLCAPSPIQIGVDETAHDGANFWSNHRGSRIHPSRKWLESASCPRIRLGKD